MCCLQFLDATFGPDLRDEEARHKLHNPVTTHEWCWTLFKPGQVVYAKMHGTWSAYIVSGIMPPRALDGRYDVYVWFVRARGNTLVREFTKFSAEMWEGEVPITSLAVVPEEYWMDDLQDQDGKKPRMPLRQKLIEEGKLLWELLKGPTSKQYNGELANRPLMALTSGDLLSSLDDVEKNLAYFLALGQRYGALVLLDEADVYLGHRTASDVARNGLVSIFLRALEYYRGVLFLTTNRVQSFDAAFPSRIHVALHYKNLSNENRERIWAHSFERLVRDSDGKIHVSAAARDYVFHHAGVQLLRLNGREIRNAMQTALALAESEAEDEGDEVVTIRASHLEAVVEMSSSFKGYIARLEGRDGCEGDAN